MRELINPGYRAFNGHVFTQLDANQYNRIQRRINKWIEANRVVPEHLLNDSHFTFNLIIGAIH